LVPQAAVGDCLSFDPFPFDQNGRASTEVDVTGVRLPQLATGKNIRVLTLVDTVSRFSPILDRRFSYCAADVVQLLERVCASIGYPIMPLDLRKRHYRELP
jgi:hypothetical protein